MSNASNNFPEDSSNTHTLTASEYHSLLAVDRRRIAIGILEGTSRTVELEELAAEIAEYEFEEESPSDSTTERVAITLHHCHLPRLHDAGLIHYDHDENTIDPTRLTNYRVEDEWPIHLDEE